MAKNLYRFYLYTVCIALLVFAMVTFGQLLQVVLEFTPLRPSYVNVPASSDVIQVVVLFVVSWIAVGLLGGLHYWLIRRDMRSDTEAGTSAVRAFFLNIVEGGAVVVAVIAAGFFVLSELAFNNNGDIAPALATTLPALLLAGLLQWERQRIPLPETAKTALIFQRLHFYGVQLILLVLLTVSWLNNFRPLVDMLFFAGKGTLDTCHILAVGEGCPTYNLFWLFVDLLWFVFFWIGYSWLNREDTATLPRLILHFASLAYGIGFVLLGLYQGISLLLMPVFHLSVTLKDVTGFAPLHDFMSPMTLGLLVVGVYMLWLRDASRLQLIDQMVRRAVAWAIGAALAAVAFWWGSGYVLLNLFNLTGTRPDASAWIAALAFIIAGIGYIPLDILLVRRNAGGNSAAGARRGFVLSLLGVGILAVAIGGAVALYVWITALVGSPLNDWLTVLHTSLAAFIIGIVLVGIYLPVALHAHLFSMPAQSLPTSVPSPSSTHIETAETLETILDELVAGHISRDVAAARIRALTSVPLSAGR